MTQTPRTDAMESAVSSECRGLTDDTRNWLMQAKSRELNRTLELETIELKRQLAECDKEYGLAILTLEQKKKLLESAEQALAERDRRLAEAQSVLKKIADFGCDLAEKFDGPCAGEIVRLAKAAIQEQKG